MPEKGAKRGTCRYWHDRLRFLNWVLDLDGVVWLGDESIPGAADAVARLQDHGDTVVFVTNNSSLPVGEVEAKLARHGIEADRAVVSSAMAAADLVEPGQRVLVCGGPGVVEALEQRGAVPVANDHDPDAPVDIVMVGFHRDFDYERMRRAAAAVRAEPSSLRRTTMRPIPRQTDRYRARDRSLPGSRRATGVDAVVAGKPYVPMANLLRARLGERERSSVTGPTRMDDCARVLGYRFALVLTGVIAAADVPSVEPRPDIVAPDLASLIDAYIRR